MTSATASRLASAATATDTLTFTSGTNTLVVTGTGVVLDGAQIGGAPWPLTSPDNNVQIGGANGGINISVNDDGSIQMASAIHASNGGNSVDPNGRFLYDQFNEQAVDYTSDSQYDFNSLLKIDPDYSWVTVQNSTFYVDSGGSHVASIYSDGSASFAQSDFTIDSYGDIVSGSISVGGATIIDVHGYLHYGLSFTASTLPPADGTAAPTQGQVAYVTDALDPTYLAPVVGGGTTVCPVFFDGTNWVCH